MRQSRTIVVAGAGIAGLTAALTIARAGFRVVVLERTAALSEAGAGIQLSPNAGHVLAGLGLEPALEAVATEPEALVVRSGRSGKRIVSLPLGESRKRYGAPYRVVHRADLQALLVEAVAREDEIELVLGTEMVEFGVHANGVTVMAADDSSHREIRAQALIAADGVRSRVRATMPGAGTLKPLGRSAWRTVVDSADIPEELHGEMGLWLGPDAHLVHYPLRGGSAMNLVAIVKDDWTGEGWSARGDPERLSARFAKWSGVPRALLQNAEAWLKWPLMAAPPRRIAAGPVALIGDAAHAMAPFLAQGGAMAIEDAAILGAVLAERPDRVDEALALYETRRRPRVRRVWRAAKSNGDLYHMGAVTGDIRDAGMYLLGGRFLLSRYDWLYKWRPQPKPRPSSTLTSLLRRTRTTPST